MATKLSESQIIRILSQNPSISINVGSKTISVVKNGVVGNKSWGKIDTLTKYYGYYQHFVDNINKRKSNKKDEEEDTNEIKIRKIKRILSDKIIKKFTGDE